MRWLASSIAALTILLAGGGSPAEPGHDEKKEETRSEKGDKGSKGGKKRLKHDRGDLSETPARAARGFEARSKEKRAKAEALLAGVLKSLKAVGGWNIDASNRAQVQAAVRKLGLEQKRVEEAGRLHVEAFAVERLALKLHIQAEQIRELTRGAKADTTKLHARQAELLAGTPQAEVQARVEGIKHLVAALVQYIQGSLAEAIVHVARSVKAYDKLSLAWAYQGSFHYLTRNRAQAIESWQRALKLDPKNDEVRRALEAVRPKSQ
jgi:tetratricopeptide (TPR) repeat protein